MKHRIVAALLFLAIFGTIIPNYAQSQAQTDYALQSVIAIEWSNNGEYLAVSSRNNVYLLNRQYEIIAIIFDNGVTDLTWSPDDNYLAGIRGIREINIPEIYVWDMSDLEDIHLDKQFSDSLGSAAYPLDLKWHPNQDILLINGPGVSIWDIETEQLLFTSRNADNVGIIRDNNVYSNAVDWSPDGSYFAGVYDNRLRLWQTNTYEQLFEIKMPTEERTIDIVWASTGTQVAVARFSNILIFDTQTEDLVQTISPDIQLTARNLLWEGNFMAFLQVNPTPNIQIWDIQDNKLVTEMAVDDLTDIAWHPSYAGLVNRGTDEGFQVFPTPFVVTPSLIQFRLDKCIDDETTLDSLEITLDNSDWISFTDRIDNLPEEQLSDACNEDLDTMANILLERETE